MEINFEKIKNTLPIEKVLRDYDLMSDLSENKYKLYGKCPIHKGDNPSAFHVDLKNNLWNCFTHCGGGSVIDLIMKIENVGVYEAGLLGEKLINGNSNKLDFATNKESYGKNKPLEFRLNLNHEHSYLSKRKITKQTAEFFDLGYCDKGIMNGKLAISIHDMHNNLVAYCGRSIDNSFPKYNFPFRFKKMKLSIILTG